MRKSILTLAALLTVSTASADDHPLKPDSIDPYVAFSHLSNIFKPAPEPTSDYLSFGATLTWQHIEVDVSHGIAGRDCEIRSWEQTCNTRQATQLAVRWYPWRKR